MHLFLSSDTIVALSTPSGIGAIGVIRLSGKDAISISEELFAGMNLGDAPSHTLHFGVIKDGTEIIDEAVAGLFKAPHSFTKEDVVEISCHGSPYILQKVLQLALSKGARLAQPGEFTMRAFMNGRFDLSQAEAVSDLISAETEASHHLAINQMRGGFSGELKALRQELLNFASLMELELDFSEEDVEFANRSQLLALLEKMQTKIKSLCDSFKLGNVMKNGVSAVIAGRPNAGKSTLLNILLNEERAIVSAIPGTTRDTIEETITINGIAFRLTDTAGIRDTEDEIEKEGVSRTMQKIQQAAVVVYLFDANWFSPDEIAADIQKLEDISTTLNAPISTTLNAPIPTTLNAPISTTLNAPISTTLNAPISTTLNAPISTTLNAPPIIVVANKIDEVEDYQNEFKNMPGIHFVSAKKGLGIENLKMVLYDAVMQGNLTKSNIILSNARHYDALNSTLQNLQTAKKGIENKLSGELVASDIRSALNHLGEITGEVTTDDLLGNIFGKFCIGK